MKKNITIIINIFALFLIASIFHVSNSINTNTLNQKAINDYTYLYTLNDDEKSINGISIKNNNIYYLIKNNNNGKYILYKQDIYTNKNKKINEIENVNCNLTKDIIICNNQNNIDIFNLDLERKNSLKNINNLIAYKDTYLNLKDNSLYLNQNKKEILYRKIPDILADIEFINYFQKQNNTYLLYKALENYYLYNINNNTFEEIEANEAKLYENGFYFYNNLEILILDLNSSQKITYQNILNSNNYNNIILSSDNKTIYEYNEQENSLVITNLKDKIIEKIDLNEIDKKINIIEKQENFIFLEVDNFSNSFYLIDTDKLNSNLETKHINNENEELISKVTSIEEEYNITVKVKDEAIIEYPDFYAESENNNDNILDAMIKIEKILTKYNKEFFNNFYNNGYKGINLYLTGTLTPSNLDTQISNPAAYSLMYNKEYMIVIDITQKNIEELLCHELMHNIEFNLNSSNIYSFEFWETYNPDNFYYNYSYTGSYIYNYTLNEADSNLIYFIDNYSHTYPEEDRARIFENICSCDDYNLLNNYENLYAKGVYIKEELLKYYPTITEVFKSLN